MTDDALREIAANYTREAGVRQLERLLAKVFRKVATKLAGQDDAQPIMVDVDDLKPYLGRPRFTPETAERTAVPGVATGLAVTGMGGDVLFIEANAHRAASARSDADRSAGRRDEGIGADRAVLRPVARGGDRHRRRRAGPRDPPARAGRRGAQGRAVRGRDDGDRTGVAGHRPPGPLGRRA